MSSGNKWNSRPRHRVLSDRHGASGSETHRVGVEPVLTIDELAALAKVSRRTIERAIACGRLRVVHLSPRIVRIPQEAAAAYLGGVDEAAVVAGGDTVHAFIFPT
jgi:excisionase family DNA binding protein